MNGTIIPELVINKILVSIVKLLRDDLEHHPLNEKDTILYKILGLDEQGEDLQINIYNYFKQARKIIETKQNLSVNFGYNQEVANMISLHIILPSETGKIGIGADEGYVDDVDDNNAMHQGYLTQVYDTTYQIMITSNNSAEVNVVYNILKSMLLMLIDHIEFMGLRNPSISGNDIVIQDDLTPVPIFHRVLNLSFTYEHVIPKMLKDIVAKRFYYQYRLVDEIEESK